MKVWQHSLRQALVDPAELAERFGIDAAPCRKWRSYPMRISPYYLSLIEEPGDPIWRQCAPDERELSDPTALADPLDEARLSPTPAVVHRYPDRVLLLAGGECATYCRFCTRKRKLGCSSMKVSATDLRRHRAYRRSLEARDVLLSGGDPLLLEDDQLETILARLYAIPHVEMVRIGSRLPVTLPERITDQLCILLRRFSPLYLNTHQPSPATSGCRFLSQTGRCRHRARQPDRVAARSQRLADILADLWRVCCSLRVRPYYLHYGSGAWHRSFSYPYRDGPGSVLRELRGPCPGMASPHYVIDAPGGKGKIPLLPESIIQLGDEALLRAPGGGTPEFPNQVQYEKRGRQKSTLTPERSTANCQKACTAGRCRLRLLEQRPTT
ncbi:MAG: lysine 2,3-aminomutase [Syntrophotaleaceae bacterium]